MAAQLDSLLHLQTHEVAPQFSSWLRALIAHRATNRDLWHGFRAAEQSSLHGMGHWPRVARLGLAMPPVGSRRSG